MARLWPPKTGFSQIAADEGHSVADDRRPVAPPVHTATSSSSPSPGLSKAMHSQRSDSGMTGESTMSGTSLDGDICAHIPYSERTGLNVPGFSQCSSCSTGLYVPVSILSHTNSFLVDTGSSATIISYKLWSAVAPATSLRPAPQLVSVTNSVLNVVGVVELPLVIGSFSAVHCVYVAKDLKPPCILGRDFLCRHNCVLDLSSSPCSLSISGTTVLLASTPFVKPPVGAVRVSLQDTTSIPPYHEMVCPASIPDAVSHVPAYSYGVVEGLHTFTSKSSVDVACVIARSVDGVVPVRLANFGPSSLTVFVISHCQIFFLTAILYVISCNFYCFHWSIFVLLPVLFNFSWYCCPLCSSPFHILLSVRFVFGILIFCACFLYSGMFSFCGPRGCVLQEEG